MSSILDEMTGKRVIQNCRNQQELIRATSVPGKPEDQGIRELNLLGILGNGKDSSPQETRNISRYVSTPSLSFLGPPNRFNHQQRPSMLQERPTDSDNDLRGDNLSASSNERNLNLTYQPKLEHKGSVYNEATLKACKPFRRHASLPASYLDEYFSVNNIRKRAQHSGVKESDSAEARVAQKKVKSKNRKPKLRLPSDGNTVSAEVEAADEAILDSTEIHENYAEKDSEEDAVPQMAPIERFRKIVQLLSFLLKVKTSIDRKHRSQNSSTVFAELDGESVTGVDCDGMVFDPNNFKAKREVHLSLEAIHILSLSPRSRTEEQLQTVLKALKTSVAAFGEYPLKMQRRLVSVGWYERFEAKRVIIRQGHKAENFYFILSGTAVVTLLINDAKTKEERDTTVAVLGKGSSFGELALLHHKTRSATVLCKDDVSLLAVSREDFRDIFMSYEDGREPEHIRFLRSVPYLKDLPLQDLTTKHDVCIFHYFRRGVVIVKESKTKWIYVVKSGSCRVLTHLSKKTAKFSRSAIDQERQKAVLPVIPLDDGDRRRALFTAAGDRVRPTAWSPDLTRAKTEPSFTSQQDTDLSLPAIVGEPEKFKKTAKNVAIATIVSALPKEGNEKEEQDQEELQRLNTKRTNNTNQTWRKMSPSDDKNGMSDPGQKGEQVVVQIELLKPKDQFGLSMVLFDNPAVKCHLVSNGAECVLIKKSWFLQHANEALLRKLRHQIPPYPSQAKLEQKMQDQANWDSFKSQTLNTLLDTLHL
ncbi:cyclic nucleotide-binding domain-containing protein 2-like isoform X1 [Acropora millepora]|uniref:cyclic nucleotide-binding domain-containing protein 2-like isoform X1 n=1 Tax=Acropora millepora TaxID=45264 RepID=UPI001CF42B05|nr:cyclic nucleotide-binding domain-containing protein 2-like isoform X1 [Acropora millepora]